MPYGCLFAWACLTKHHRLPPGRGVWVGTRRGYGAMVDRTHGAVNEIGDIRRRGCADGFLVAFQENHVAIHVQICNLVEISIPSHFEHACLPIFIDLMTHNFTIDQKHLTITEINFVFIQISKKLKFSL